MKLSIRKGITLMHRRRLKFTHYIRKKIVTWVSKTGIVIVVFVSHVWAVAPFYNHSYFSLPAAYILNQFYRRQLTGLFKK